MGKLLLTGVDGNLGSQAAEYLLELEPVDNLIFCGYSEAALQKYADMGVGPTSPTSTSPMDCKRLLPARTAWH